MADDHPITVQMLVDQLREMRTQPPVYINRERKNCLTARRCEMICTLGGISFDYGNCIQKEIALWDNVQCMENPELAEMFREKRQFESIANGYKVRFALINNNVSRLVQEARSMEAKARTCARQQRASALDWICNNDYEKHLKNVERAFNDIVEKTRALSVKSKRIYGDTLMMIAEMKYELDKMGYSVDWFNAVQREISDIMENIKMNVKKLEQIADSVCEQYIISEEYLASSANIVLV